MPLKLPLKVWLKIGENMHGIIIIIYYYLQYLYSTLSY